MLVCCDERERLRECLGHEHSIKRIAMMFWQGSGGECMRDRHRKLLKVVDPKMLSKITLYF